MKLKPTDHTNSEVMNKFSNSRLIEVITQGTADKSLMPGWGGRLTKEEIESAASDIRLLSAF